MSILKKLSTILFFFVIFFIPLNVYAFSYYSTQSQDLDTKLTDSSNTIYLEPTKIYVTQVTTVSDKLSRDSAKWVQSLYYYCITRLHLSDLPYTYLLDENGIIYQGKNGGVGANPELKEVEGAVTIGYLSNNSSLSTRAGESLRQIVEEVSSSWGISQLQIVKLYLNKEEGKLSTVSAVEIDGDFSKSVGESLEGWEGNSEENQKYKTKIEEVTYEKNLEIGERLKVKLKVRNANDFIWFTKKDPIYVSVKDGVESSFAVNQVWESFSKPVSISGKDILPGESVEVEFELEGRVFLGEAKESFELLKFEGKPFEESSFDVEFEITRGEKQLVEIASPKYSFVNIRDCRWYSCETLDSADNGEIFILELEEEGWSKIRYGTDLYGWVNSAYLKKL